MISQFDYAALSAAVYNNVRGQDNKLTLPTGWTELPIYPNGIVSSVTGFTARAYSNGTDIVIAYKGTDTVNVAQTAQDFLFGNPAAIGGSVQLVQAALFYEQVKAQYGGNITFTGHSLGGGLASVIGVWFGKSATTYAQAPFELAAANPVAIAAVEAALALNLYADSDFLLFNPLDYAARQANITNYFVQGEVLSQVLAWLPNVVGPNNPIIVGGEQNVSAGDLHSMVLHASLIMQPALRLDTYALPNLMAEIFDKALYFSDPNTRKADFLSHLLNDQIRVGYTNADGLLSRFAGDIDKLTQYGANLKDGALGKALIDVAIADYYFMQSGFTKDFFNAVTGGIAFDLADIGANWPGNKTVGQLDNAIISQYLNGDQTARTLLAQDNYWSIQSGADALNATGTGTNNDAMIGGTTNDTLDGGAGNDFLYGGDGIDTLTGGAGGDWMIGGAGNDTLDGGAGYDTYTLEGRDTVRDSDGNGILKDKAGNIISGVIEKRADGTYAYLSNPSVSVTLDASLTLTMTLADGSIAVIENFTSGNLGLQLADTSTQAPATTLITGDIIPTDFNAGVAGIQAAADANGNPIGTAGAYEDILLGTAGSDHILSGDLADNVGGGAGDDWIEAGTGSDYVNGDAGNDLIEGDAGADILAGDAGDDRIYAGIQTDTATAIASGSTDIASNLKGDWLSGGDGNDTLVAGADNDVLAGGAGSDLLIAGAGDDNILGDAEYTAQAIMETTPRYTIGNTGWYHSSTEPFNWGYTDVTGSRVFSPVTGATNPVGGAADIIYAGDGADHVWAGEGNDVVYGEGGADKLIGEAGSDILMGGAGDDTLFGDATYVDAALHGDDYIDGGDGNDALQGEGGNDILMGGTGDDQLTGGQGTDTLMGGAGNDTLVGGNGDGSSTDGDTLDGGDGNDTMYGDAGNDTLLGGLGDDRLYGGNGANYLDGGDGTDILNSGGPGSSLFGGAGNDDISAGGGGNYLDGEDGTDTLVADGGNNTLFGGAGNDTLSAYGGNNYLDGEAGNNTLIATGGNNTLFAGAGDDNLQATGGNNYLDGGDGTNLLVADGGNNTLFAGAGADTLSSAGGGSYLDSGAGNDTLIADTGNNTLLAGAGDDYLSASGGNNHLNGGDGADTLIADGGGNTLYGGAGNDRLFAYGGPSTGSGQAANLLDGGDGRDWYVFDAGFGVNHIADSGTGGNAIQFKFSFANSGITIGLGSLKLSFANGDELHIDNFDANDPAGTCSIDTFAFADRTLSLQEILDIGMDVVGTPNADIIQGTGMNERINALAGDDTILAGGGNDTVNAGEGNDFIDGGTGADAMTGGLGDDTYAVDVAGDVIVENANEGTDTVQSGISYALGNNLENLTLTGPTSTSSGQASTGSGQAAFNLNATGNILDNTLTGNGGNNVLDGQVGADSMAGGAGDDTYIIDNSNDLVTENLNAGTDSVNSSISYTLTDNVENLTLTGSTSTSSGQAGISGTGNALDNIITGNDQANTLDGGAGADAMTGGYGNDTYVVDNAGDVVTESQIGLITTHSQWDWLSRRWSSYTTTTVDTDTVNSSISYTLGNNLENLNLTGPASTGSGQASSGSGQAAFNLNGTGNELNNTINGNGGNNTLLGNAGNDTLDGGAGADVMDGGTGNDIYYVDNIGDQVIETNAGHTVTYAGGSYYATDYEQAYSSVSFTLTDNVEQLNLTGSDNIDGGGSAQDNLIIGNDGINALSGGMGNDTYRVQTLGDTVTENLDEGIDSVESSVDFTLGDNVENLTLTGTTSTGSGQAGISGTGNALDNNINGNTLDNTLSGEAGNDSLNGGAGSDTVLGGDGNDTIRGGYDDYSSTSYGLLSNSDVLDGGAGDDYIDGGSGNDTIIGGTGDDTLYGGNDDGYEESRPLPNNDTIDGGDGYDQIDGGSGADTLYGGAGDDVIYGGDNGWNATTYDPATNTYAAMSNDDYIDGGDGSDQLFGQNGNDILLGGAGNDYMDGGVGDDTLVGGAGSDYLYGDEGNDVLTGSQQADLLADGFNAGVPSGNLTINAAADDGAIPSSNLTGVAASYTLQGVIGDGPTTDQATGNGWDYDFYKFSNLNAGYAITVSTFTGFNTVIGLYDAAGNLVTESDDAYGWGGSGNMLDSNFTFNISISGDYYLAISEFNNYLPINPFDAAANGSIYQHTYSGGDYTATVSVAPVLDTLEGGLGDDTYVVGGVYTKAAYSTINECGDPVAGQRLQWATDSVAEYAGEGYDIVMSSASFTLSADVEELRLTFDANTAVTDAQFYADLVEFGQDGTGNDLNNVIVGNELNNRLDGGLGADTLEGGAGNDTYVIDQAGDTIIEQAGGGIDTVESSISYELLDTNLENLTLLDGAVSGVGNAADNVINGNAGFNDLYGGDGNDILIANGGGDALYGGAGNDRYVFRLGDGAVWVADSQGADTVFIGNDLTVADLETSRSGDDLVMSVIGTTDSITLNNWFAQAEGVSRIEFCDGTALDKAGIDGLFNAPPVANADAVTVSADAGIAAIAVAGLLANDTDPNAGDTLSMTGFDAVTALGNTVTLDANGNLALDIGNNNYQSLGAGQTATDSFSYTVADTAGAVSSATVAVTIAGVNDAPVTATPIVGQQTNEDAPFSFTVPANTFTDIDNGDTLSYGAMLADGTALPSWLTFDAATQTFSGIPSNWDVGSYSVTVTATDTGGLSASSTFAVDVANVNDAPTVSVALLDHAALQDTAFSFTVPAGTFDDVDFIHGDTLSYGATLADGTALPGWLTFDAATGTFNGIPSNWDVGNLNVVVTATDTGGLSASSNFALNVINANDAPTANADAGVATEDGGAVLLNAAALLVNDTDPDFIHGDALNIVGVSQAASGAVVSLLNGAVQYDIGTLFQSLGQGQTATDTFSYTVGDLAGATSTATVTMTITGANDAPVTAGDAAAVQEDAALAATGNVLANDSDADQGTVLSVANAGTLQGNYGSLLLNGDGSYTYTLDNVSLAVQSLAAGQIVTETFAYQATDGIAFTPATLTVSITGSNDAPVTVADVATAQEDITIIATGNVLANDTDVDQGTVLSVANAGLFAGNYGQLTLATDGSYSYALNNASLGIQSLAAGQVVTETFAYAATDGLIATPSTLTVTITGTNDAPVTVADAAAVQEDISIAATGNVLINDSDVDQGAALSVLNAGAFAGNYGQLTLATDGNYSYALDNPSTGSGQARAAVQSLAAGQVVTETFAYEATDGTVATPSALTVSITGTNDAPVAAADAAYVREDLNITATGNVLGNDSDVDQGTVLSVADAGVRAGSYGSLNLAADGSYSYAPDNASMTVQSLGRDAQVAEHFGYTATDGMVGVSAVLDVFLNGTNDAPILVAPLADQNFTFHKHFSWQMPEGSFIDIDQGDTLTYGAALADGSALPDWLNFDAATRTFSGETPKQVGFVDIQVTATDGVAATGSTAGSLSASDVFRISVSHGNEGVGNGEDAPPPGHDHNTNDGAGTSPGHPGKKGGNDYPTASAKHPQEQDRQDSSSDAKTHKDDTRQQDSEDTEDSGSHRTDELIRTWFEEESASEQYSSFGALDRHGAWGGQIDRQVNRNVARGISGDVSQEWERMNARLKEHLAQSGGDDGLFAESGTGSRSFGLFGSGGSQGIAQLGMGSGQQLKSLAGLKEGLERLGC